MTETAFQTSTLVTLVPLTCYKCGVAFGVPAYFKEQRIKDRHSFYCPNGHGQHFIGKTEEQRLREQLETERQRSEWNRRKAERIERQRRALKGQVTKIKKRVGHGVCPCCSRSFENLRRHMETKHPTYSEVSP